MARYCLECRELYINAHPSGLCYRCHDRAVALWEEYGVAIYR